MDHKAKPHSLGTKERIAVLRALDDGTSIQKICKDFSVSKSQVYRIKEKRKQIEEDNDMGTSGSGKRHRKSSMIDIDKALKLWFNNMMAKKGARISGPILQSKAMELYKSAAEAKGEELDPDFVISPSWIQRWKLRNKITWKKEEGEIAASDFAAADKWKTDTMLGILARYDDKDIWNADETGLYWQGLPNRGYVHQGTKLLGGKKALARITVLVVASMTGEKRRLLVIGTAKKPRSFPYNQDKLPVDYMSSKNAWMTSYIWEKWLRDWDRSLPRKICLLVDNCSAHPKVMGLKNIEVVFLPPNTTAIMQPMDQGCIKIFNGNYRKQFNTRIIADMEASTEDSLDAVKKVSILEAVSMAKLAWEKVSPEHIIKCFKHGGICRPDEQAENEGNATGLDIVDIVGVPSNLSEEEFRAMVDVDEELSVMGDLNNNDLLSVSQEDEEEEEDEEEPLPPLTSRELMDGLAVVRRFALEAGMGDSIKDVEKAILESVLTKKKQKSITDFFKPI